MISDESAPIVLYVEDDDTLRFITTENLEREHYRVIEATDGKEAWELFRKGNPDICILDVNLPKMDGFSLARQIREVNQDIPILFVTAKSMKEDRLEGLLLGGDDYLVKPFSIEELILKIKIFLRRSKINSDDNQQEIIRFSSFTLNRNTMVLSGLEGDVKLTYREVELLTYFVRNSGKLVTREQLLGSLWGGNDYFAGRSLDVFISRLRKYLAAGSAVKIENRHGIGFIFKQ